MKSVAEKERRVKFVYRTATLLRTTPAQDNATLERILNAHGSEGFQLSILNEGPNGAYIVIIMEQKLTVSNEEGC